MDTDTFSLFAALLSLIALFGAIGLVGLRLVAGRSALASELLAAVRPVRFHLGALVAASAMGGSLWFSEVEGFPPCEFCWYQRIAMYPLVVVLGVAAWRRDENAVPTATILAGIGAALAVYHYQLQRFPDQGSSCDATAPCTAIWVEEFGFVTIPAMAFAGFAAILALVWAPRAGADGPGGEA